MGRLHAIWGITFVGVFLATGVYMRLAFPAAYANDSTMRMLFRSAHIYILMAAMINLALGTYLSPRPAWRRRIQSLGSAMLLVAPPILTVAFFVEPAPRRLDRPLVLLAIIFLVTGTALHWIASGQFVLRRMRGDFDEDIESWD